MSTRRRKPKFGPRFVAVWHWMMDSAAWVSLSGPAVKIFLDVWKRHNGSNNGQIVYGVRDAEKIGIGKSQAAVALAELVDRGFLKVTRDSQFRMKSKEAREWAITVEPIGGQPATKDFMNWSLRKNISRSGIADRQSGPPDREHENRPENGFLVRPAGPSEAEASDSRSGGSDTSRSTIRESAQTGAPAPALSPKSKRLPRFGDRAKAERIARNPIWADAITEELAARRSK